MKSPPTVVGEPGLFCVSLTSLISTADTYRSSVRPVSPNPALPHQSGLTAFMVTGGVGTTRSGVPIVHALPSANFSGGGMSAGLPRGVP